MHQKSDNEFGIIYVGFRETDQFVTDNERIKEDR